LLAAERAGHRQAVMALIMRGDGLAGQHALAALLIIQYPYRLPMRNMIVCIILICPVAQAADAAAMLAAI
ncbi:hypothetical protein, partial [Xanthomonas pisi]|uniref:hypothetical protein n=1 Tax=Xanthomonas pisi TaxID=56457 RepID=UPI001CA5E371